METQGVFENCLFVVVSHIFFLRYDELIRFQQKEKAALDSSQATEKTLSGGDHEDFSKCLGLALWIKDQHQLYIDGLRGKIHRMREDRVMKLEKIKFTWASDLHGIEKQNPDDGTKENKPPASSPDNSPPSAEQEPPSGQREIRVAIKHDASTSDKGEAHASSPEISATMVSPIVISMPVKPGMATGNQPSTIYVSNASPDEKRRQVEREIKAALEAVAPPPTSTNDMKQGLEMASIPASLENPSGTKEQPTEAITSSHTNAHQPTPVAQFLA